MKKGDIAALRLFPSRPSPRTQTGFQSQVRIAVRRVHAPLKRTAPRDRVPQALEVGHGYSGLTRSSQLYRGRRARHKRQSPRQPTGAGLTPVLDRDTNSARKRDCKCPTYREDRHEMVVILDRERLESSLPDVACRAVMPMVPACVRRPATASTPHVAILMRPDHQVKVVGASGSTPARPCARAAGVDHGLDERRRNHRACERRASRRLPRFRT